MLTDYRDWEQWDKPGISAAIDSYWLATNEEVLHRKKLAALVQQWSLLSDRILEVGCGSGLVYQELVPAILPNKSYVGVDISETMLEIAANRFREGKFLKDDLYQLSLAENTFDVVAAFEVFGHIGDIQKPIREMFRVCSRLMIFTVWTAPESSLGHEIIGDSVFLHRVFSKDEIMKEIGEALEGQSYTVSEQPISNTITAYIIKK